MKKKRILAVLAVSATLALCGGALSSCDLFDKIGGVLNPTSSSSEEQIYNCNLEISQTEGQVMLGEKLTLTATTNDDATYIVQWKSSDSSVATVVNGVVTGIGQGTATVTVSCKVSGSSKILATAQCKITVTVPEGYYVIPFGDSSAAGNSVVLENPGQWFFYTQTSSYAAKENYFMDNTAHISFTELSAAKEWYLRYQPDLPVGTAYDISFTLTLDTPAYIRFGGPKGERELQYFEAGTHEVTLKNRTVDGATPFSVCLLSAEPDGIETIGEFKSVMMGGTFAISIADVTTTPALNISAKSATIDLTTGKNALQLTATDPDGGDIVSWTSSDESVATVDGSGLVTGIKEGVAIVTATSSDGKTVTCTVTVKSRSISLDKSSAVIDLADEDKTVTLQATVSDGGAVVWTSSDENVATVENGVVTAVGKGTVTITAASGNETATCLITVKDSSELENGYNIVFGKNEAVASDPGIWYYYYDTGAMSNDPVQTAVYNATQNTLTVTATASKTISLRYQPNLEVGKYFKITFTLSVPAGTAFSTLNLASGSVLENGVPNVTANADGSYTFVYIGQVSSTPFSIQYKISDATLTVSDISVEECAIPVALDRETAEIDLAGTDKTLTLQATVAEGFTAVWKSSDESVAAVENGVVTAVGVGTATITATVGKITAICTVTVTDSAFVEPKTEYDVVFGKNETVANAPGIWYYYYDTGAMSNNPVQTAVYDTEENTLTVTATASKTISLRYQPNLAVGKYFKITFTLSVPEGTTFSTLNLAGGSVLENGVPNVTANADGSYTFTYIGEVSETPFSIQFKISGTTITVSEISVEEYISSEPENPEDPEDPGETEQYALLIGSTGCKDADVCADPGTWYCYTDRKSTVSSAEYNDGEITLVTTDTAVTTAAPGLRYQPEFAVGTSYTVTFTITSTAACTVNVGATTKETIELEADTPTTVTFTFTVESAKPFSIQPKIQGAATVTVSGIVFTEVTE